MLQQSRLSWSKFWNVYRTLSVLKNVIWRPVNLVCIFVSRYRRNIPLFQFMLNNSSLYFPIMINGGIVDTQYNYALRPRERNSNIRGSSTHNQFFLSYLFCVIGLLLFAGQTCNSVIFTARGLNKHIQISIPEAARRNRRYFVQLQSSPLNLPFSTT